MTQNMRLNLVRAAWGAVLLTAPDILAGRDRSHGTATAARRTIQVLGGRQVIQAALTAWRPSTAVLTAGAATDVLHAASMAALAAVDARWRNRAAADAALGALLAASGARAAWRHRTAGHAQHSTSLRKRR